MSDCTLYPILQGAHCVFFCEYNLDSGPVSVCPSVRSLGLSEYKSLLGALVLSKAVANVIFEVIKRTYASKSLVHYFDSLRGAEVAYRDALRVVAPPLSHSYTEPSLFRHEHLSALPVNHLISS